MSEPGPISAGILSMGEAGNLGDDLILLSTVDAIYESAPDTEVIFLGHGVPVDWQRVAGELGWKRTPRVRTRGQEIPGTAWDARLLADCDLVIFGGGGLLQNSHSLHEPYQWLGALPVGSTRPPIVALGLGLGPLNDQWRTVLRSRPSPFDLAYVRDNESLHLAQEELQWSDVRLASDFVTPDFLARIGIDINSRPTDPMLGVSVRAWPGLTPQAVADRIRDLCVAKEITHVVLNVIEDKAWDHSDLEFTAAIAALLPPSLQTRLHIYDAPDPIGYTRDLAACTDALSMKFHSSIIWSRVGADIAPIIYAPKVASLFGLPYRGLEISNSSARPIMTESLVSVRDVLSALVRDPSSVERKTGTRYFSQRERFTFRSQRLSAAVQSRLPTALRG